MTDGEAGNLCLSSLTSRCLNKSRQVLADFPNKLMLRHLLLGELSLVFMSLYTQVMNKSAGPRETEQRDPVILKPLPFNRLTVQTFWVGENPSAIQYMVLYGTTSLKSV
jgi:hypothetical protein